MSVFIWSEEKQFWYTVLYSFINKTYLVRIYIVGYTLMHLCLGTGDGYQGSTPKSVQYISRLQIGDALLMRSCQAIL